MSDWQEKLASVLHPIEKWYDAIKYRIYDALGGVDSVEIVPYRGYGNRQKLYLTGRVLEDKGIPPPSEQDTLWDNLSSMVKRFNSREIPYARVLVRFAGAEYPLTANMEGFFELELELPQPLDVGRPWQPITVELLSPRPRDQGRQGPATGQILVPPDSAYLGVISDLDDTVIQSNATSLLRMARTTFLGSARTRLPFPGVAALYRALHAGRSQQAHNPLFYVSNGLWNLYDMLVEFMDLQGIPPGPMLLRNWGLSERALLFPGKTEHKLGAVRRILETYPDLPFVLIGDSGEADPEIYHQVVDEHRGRIQAVYIRSVHTDPEKGAMVEALIEKVAEVSSTMILAQNSLAMARHALQKGWISQAGFDDIEAESLTEQGVPVYAPEVLD